MILNAFAKSFTPGAVTHIIKKKVTWHPKGITSVKRFFIEPCIALPVRELVGIPISEIKQSNPEEANPFKIPSVDYDYQIDELENRLINLMKSNNNDINNNTNEIAYNCANYILEDNCNGEKIYMKRKNNFASEQQRKMCKNFDFTFKIRKNNTYVNWCE